MKRRISFVLSLSLILSPFSNVFAIDTEKVYDMAESSIRYLYKTVQNPQIGAIGGEWTILALKRSGADIPREYYEKYYRNVENYVKECEGVIHKRKYTEYSRVILALSAIEKDPQNVAGYNLLKYIADYEKTIWQGTNGPIYALLAIDSKNYEIPQNTEALVQATKSMYINRILELQLPDGGWSLSSRGGQTSDADITGMALQALAKYRDDAKVSEAIEKALLCMSSLQDTDGGFSSYGEKNCESTVQMLVALCELGIKIDDKRFVKNGKTLLDSLESFYIKTGGFSHIIGGDTDLMATEQGLCALVALKRVLEGKSSLYSMKENEVVKYSAASVYLKAVYMLEQLLREKNK